MGYKLEIEKLEHPLLKPLLEEVLPIFDSLKVKFFVIGATARDIMMEVHQKQSGRRTQDLDIAIAIEDWKKFEEIKKSILQLEHFEEDVRHIQKLRYQKYFEVDLVPYGAIAQDKNKIFWPPDQSIAMSVLGYEAIEDDLVEVDFGNSLKVKVASLSGIFILKLIAWKDRHLQGNKDAEDIGFILQNYLPINEERAATEHYEAVYELENFSIIIGSAVLLGIDISLLLASNQDAKKELQKIIKTEINKELESPLFNQIIETNSISFDEIREAMDIFYAKLN